MAKTLLIVCAFALLAADLALMKKEKDEDFDGVSIGLVSKPKVCDKKTKKGDNIRVTFNVSTGYIGPQKHAQGFEKRYETEPVEFVLGGNMMIRGFEVGLMDMCVGEVRYITVPEDYAYGVNGLGDLPARATLYFFATLHSIETLGKDFHYPFNTFKAMDTDKDHLLSHEEVKAFLIASKVKDEPGEHGLKQMMRDIFKEEDRDSNGFITHKEFSGNKHDYV